MKDNGGGIKDVLPYQKTYRNTQYRGEMNATSEIRRYNVRNGGINIFAITVITVITVTI